MSTGSYVEMQTEIMDRYDSIGPVEVSKTYVATTRQAEEAEEIRKLAKKHYYFALIKKIVEEKYDIGQLLEVYQIFGGYINTTFGIYTLNNGEKETWLFRMYNLRKDIDTLQFEHKMLRHAKKNGFSYGAGLLETKEGLSYQREKVVMDNGKEEEYFFAIFEYLDGKAVYDWNLNWSQDGVKDLTIATGARSLAEFHSSLHDFDPEGLHGDNIMDNEDAPANDLIKKFPQTLQKYRKLYTDYGLDNGFTQFFDHTWHIYERMCPKVYIPPEDYAKMLILPCHCDYHPGNLKYRPDGSVSGSFDYDMSKIDSRLFEIGLAVHYCFSDWALDRKGSLPFDRVALFIKSYNKAVENIGKIPPLSYFEKSYMYEVIVQGTAYVAGWCTSSMMYTPTQNSFEFLHYLRHFAICMEWLENHETEIREWAKTL